MNPERFLLRSMFPFTIALGVMLSPDSLMILGNGMGETGPLFLAFILLAMLAHVLTVLSYGELFLLYPLRQGEPVLLKAAFGSLPATVLLLCSRVMFVICASTGILATAGYVFNEVFVYWFPNLGFSFCLLGFLLMLNLMGWKIAARTQLILVTVALLGLILLTVVGQLEWSNPDRVGSIVFPGAKDLARVGVAGLLLFLGHDLAQMAGNNQQERRGSLVVSMLFAIGLSGVIFSTWGMVSLRHVPMERLADTSIPYAVAARAVLGQMGRIVMGVVVITGSLSAVNALLLSVSRSLVSMAHEGLLPSLFAGTKERPTAILIVLTVGVAAMMGLGMAGEPVLEIYTKAAILFWLLTYAAVHLAILIERVGPSKRRLPSHKAWHPAVAIIGFFVMLIASAALLWTDTAATELMKFMLTVSVSVSIFCLAWLGFKRSKIASGTTRIGGA
ncbi:MAG: APC family permease [Deltaproteobacteria bacterium]|nr:MAG: APC family permease [Deltaproteobacteria bacterium]